MSNIYQICMIFDNLKTWGDCCRTKAETIINLLSWTSILGILVFFIIAIIVAQFKRARQITRRSLLVPFILVWLLGFAIYDIGMYTGEEWSLIGNSPMAIIYAFGMFVFSSDISAIHEPFTNSGFFMLCFSLVHFLAALVSLAFVLKHFGFNTVETIKGIIATSLFGRSKDTTYIFWGMNDATYNLAKSINLYHKENNNESYRIIIIRSNSDADVTSHGNGIERLFNFLSSNDNNTEKICNIEKCLTINTFANISNLDNSSQNCSIDIWRTIGLKSVSKLINRKTKRDIHIFFLSENEMENINAVSSLRDDTTLHNFISTSKEHNVKIYCHARFNSVHRTIEDDQFTENMEVKVVDSSHMSVELLKQNVDLQPVSFVNIEKDATVSSPFNSLIVGFSEVGQDALSFLYEFGAFVKTGSVNDNVERSELNCHVVDKSMSDLAGLFYVNAPSVKLAMPFLNNEKEDTSPITLHQIDCRSVAFYQQLELWIKDNLNYVVVCTEDDELNISLAVRILKLSIRYRKTMEKFCILVRIHNDENGHIQRIAEHYNRLWAAELHSTDKKKRTHQKTISTNEHISMPIYLFGMDKQTYTYENIISDDLEVKAKQYKDKYDKSINELKRLSGNKTEDILTWENEHKDLMQLTDEYKGFSPTYSGIMRLRRIQSQNIANSLHLITKQRLALRALDEEGYSLLKEHQLFRKENEVEYIWKDYIKPNPSVTRVLDVLAQTEHLRWNASHEILGYCDEGDENHKDEARLQHGCLKKWQELSTQIQSYDYNVVDVSLGLIDISVDNK